MGQLASEHRRELSPNDLQRLASDPEVSAWVSASAGSGKTKVLVDRFLKLLLEGNHPTKILCLTFTKAAAQEMINRLTEKTGHWAICSHDQLFTELQNLYDQAPSQERMDAARILFYQLLDLSGQLRIQTIHGFCQMILKKFPLEAQLNPCFQVLEETEQQQKLQRVLEKQLGNVEGDKDLERHLELMSAYLSPQSFLELIDEIFSSKDHCQKWMTLSPEQITHILEDSYGIEVSQTNQQCLQSLNQDENIDLSGLRRVIKAMSDGKANDQEAALTMDRWIHHIEDRIEHFESYKQVFLTKSSGTLRKKLVSKDVVTLCPDAKEIMTQEGLRIEQVQNWLNTLQMVKISHSIWQVAAHIWRAWQQELEANAYLTFDDLIFYTQKLLKQSSVMDWVHYKLDGGIDHILVDEAQDTNAMQWAVIDALASEFYSGFNQSEIRRTLFAVGDPKQSIYSFQGADPVYFNQYNHYFAQKASQGNVPWRDIALQTSFRSTPSVLKAVDTIFNTSALSKGVISEGGHLQHNSFRLGQKGQVEVWPLIKKEDHPQSTLPQIVAQNIATQVKKWLDDKVILHSKGRPIEPRDIMILVQQRCAFMRHLVQAFQKYDIPISGLDRLHLSSHIVVEDLLALGEFLLNTMNDYALASILKSPLFGVSEEDLFELSVNRAKKSLWENMQEIAEQNPKYKTIMHTLGTWKAASQQKTPYGFYAQILSVDQIREKYIDRMGVGVHEILDEFLNLVQTYQSQPAPTLHGVIEWIRQVDIEIKKDTSSQIMNEVRLMTVHGSKGLQAPIVFMPDTVRMPKMKQRIFWSDAGLLWNASMHLKNDTIQALKDEVSCKQFEEYHRLLYVAMTRAEDTLIISGWNNYKNTPDLCWYKHLVDSLGPVSEQQDEKLILENPQEKPVVLQSVQQKTIVADSMPSWLGEKIVSEKLIEETIAASHSAQSADKTSEQALRGIRIHKLLEVLPEISEESQEKHAFDLLRSWRVPKYHAQELYEHVRKILDKPELSFLFQENSGAEVPLVGVVDGQSVSGQIDRIVFDEGKIIHIVDYKSDAKVPDCMEKVPKSYLKQLRYYQEMLRNIYPDHVIKKYLLWTHTTQLMEICENSLLNFVAA